MINQRLNSRPVTRHADYDLASGSPSYPSIYHSEKDKKWRKIVSRRKEGYWHFAICWWGDIGRIVDLDELDSNSYYLIHDRSEAGNVREILSIVDWKKYPTINVGAPQIQLDLLVKAYNEYKVKYEQTRSVSC